MTCLRCRTKLMAWGPIYTEDGPLFLWRCWKCGEYIDQVIIENRQLNVIAITKTN